MKRLLLIGSLIATVTCFTAQAADAKALYEEHCAKCHGKDGKGQTKMGQKLGAKDYTDAKVQAEMKDDKMAKAIKEGVKENDKTLMKPFGDVVTSEDDVKALVKYVRAFKK